MQTHLLITLIAVVAGLPVYAAAPDSSLVSSAITSTERDSVGLRIHFGVGINKYSEVYDAGFSMRILNHIATIGYVIGNTFRAHKPMIYDRNSQEFAINVLSATYSYAILTRSLDVELAGGIVSVTGTRPGRVLSRR